nr:hypothetical protein CFP56_15902 [Quercus suber]
MEKAKLATKPSPQASIKGKKALARSRTNSNVADSKGSSPVLQATNNSLCSTSVPNLAPPNGKSNQEAATEAQPAIIEVEIPRIALVEAREHDGGDFEVHAYQKLCASELGLEMVRSTEVESVVDDASVNCSRYDGGRICSGGPCVEEHVQSVVGMVIGGTGYKCNSEDGLEANRLGFEEIHVIVKRLLSCETVGEKLVMLKMYPEVKIKPEVRYTQPRLLQRLLNESILSTMSQRQACDDLICEPE